MNERKSVMVFGAEDSWEIIVFTVQGLWEVFLKIKLLSGEFTKLFIHKFYFVESLFGIAEGRLASVYLLVRIDELAFDFIDELL